MCVCVCVCVSAYHISALLLPKEPAGVAQLGAVVEQHDVCSAVAKVTVGGKPQGGVVGGAGMRAHHDVGETANQLPPVFLVNG